MIYIKGDLKYAQELHKRLMHEQDSASAAGKLTDQQFVEMMEAALYFMERDSRIMWRTPAGNGDAMRDITGA